MASPKICSLSGLAQTYTDTDTHQQITPTNTNTNTQWTNKLDTWLTNRQTTNWHTDWLTNWLKVRQEWHYRNTETVICWLKINSNKQSIGTITNFPLQKQENIAKIARIFLDIACIKSSRKEDIVLFKKRSHSIDVRFQTQV